MLKLDARAVNTVRTSCASVLPTLPGLLSVGCAVVVPICGTYSFLALLVSLAIGLRPMREPRPKHEDAYVSRLIKPLLKRLSANPALLVEFMAFACEEGGADPLKFPPRMAHVFRGRPPTAFVLALLLRFDEKKRSTLVKRKERRSR